VGGYNRATRQLYARYCGYSRARRLQSSTLAATVGHARRSRVRSTVWYSVSRYSHPEPRYSFKKVDFRPWSWFSTDCFFDSYM